MERYRLLIEDKECWGCRACEVACKLDKPFQISLIRIQEEWKEDEDGNMEFIYRLRVCRHCEEPECVEACPEEAIYKREDGIVLIDRERCTGCGLCIEACPYDAIWIDEEKAIKCDMCLRRVEYGLLPVCADGLCIGEAIRFEPVLED